MNFSPYPCWNKSHFWIFFFFFFSKMISILLCVQCLRWPSRMHNAKYCRQFFQHIPISIFWRYQRCVIINSVIFLSMIILLEYYICRLDHVSTFYWINADELDTYIVYNERRKVTSSAKRKGGMRISLYTRFGLTNV